MKIAMCFYGLVGGSKGENGAGEYINIDECYRSYDKRIFKKNDPIDFFVHSWSVDKKDKILGLYHPKEYIIDKQKIFDDGKSRMYRVMSHWYSVKRSLELKSMYEREHDFTYDCVMINRFDVVFFKPLVFSDYDLHKFWAVKNPKYAQPGEGRHYGLYLQDFFFFSNSENMDYLGRLFDTLEVDNSHLAAHLHLTKKFKISDIGFVPAQDYDLHRWWSRSATDWPRKWYNGIQTPVY